MTHVPQCSLQHYLQQPGHGDSDGQEPACNVETQVQPLGREDPLEKEWQPTPYPCLENPMDRGA